MIRSSPPAHEKSWRREDIFLPVTEPRKSAVPPHINAAVNAAKGDISLYPQLIPVAAESSELARASAAASPAEIRFEWSISAAVSSR